MYKDIDIFDLLTDESKEKIMKELKEAKSEAKKIGIAEGEKLGIEKGEKLGIAKALLESAKRMIKKGIYSLEEIAENLYLPLNEVQTLSAQMT